MENLQNRTLKFRAWDKKQNRMITEAFSIYYNGRIQFEDMPNQDNFILMQYTGMCDKNGKEIFEGDVVEVEYSRMGGGIPEKVRGICEIRLGNTMFGQLYSSTLLENNITTHKYPMILEIVGNIYENENLI